MKTTRIYFFAVLLLLYFGSVLPASIRTVDMTEEEKQAMRQAAKARIAVRPELKQDLYEYYRFHDDGNENIFVSGGKTQDFSATMQVDMKNGDVLIAVECISDERIEYNLTYNFAWIEQQFYAKPKSGEDDRSGIRPERIESYRLHSVEIIPPRGGRLYLYKGDIFIKRVKIWDLFIWDDLLKDAQANKTESYRLEYPLVLKIGENTFYTAKPGTDLTAVSIIKLKAVRTAQEKLAASAKPEYSDRQMKTTIGKNERGELEYKLEQVQVKPE